MAKYGEGVISVYDMPHDEEFEHRTLSGRTVTVGGRAIPVVREVDVCVVGGGPGGTAAAVARRGPARIRCSSNGTGIWAAWPPEAL